MSETKPDQDTTVDSTTGDSTSSDKLPKLHNLTIHEKLGGGGSGTVYAAYNTALQKKVAVKILSNRNQIEISWKARFLREAQLMSSLSHPNIASVFTFTIAESGDAVLVMEFIEGDTLQKVIESSGPFNSEKTRNVAFQLCKALEYAHQNGIIHRDIKPANVIITTDGTPKLIDFGLAKAAVQANEQRITATGQFVGTPAYMSPEQCEGKPATEKSDIYSLCCLIYFMLTGKSLFSGNNIEMMLKHVNKTASIKGLKIPEDLRNIISKGLQKNPEKRFSNFSELAACLENADLNKKTMASTTQVVLLPLLIIIALTFLSVAVPRFYDNGTTSNTITYEDPRFRAAAAAKIEKLLKEGSLAPVSIAELREILDKAPADSDIAAFALFALMRNTTDDNERLKYAENLIRITSLPNFKIRIRAYDDNKLRASGLELAAQILAMQKRYSKALNYIDELEKLFAEAEVGTMSSVQNACINTKFECLLNTKGRPAAIKFLKDKIREYDSPKSNLEGFSLVFKNLFFQYETSDDRAKAKAVLGEFLNFIPRRPLGRDHDEQLADSVLIICSVYFNEKNLKDAQAFLDAFYRKLKESPPLDDNAEQILNARLQPLRANNKK